MSHPEQPPRYPKRVFEGLRSKFQLTFLTSKLNFLNLTSHKKPQKKERTKQPVGAYQQHKPRSSREKALVVE